ncbi:NADH dehydrogenase [ubiquinone] 1 alpha subcomplex assembly factor 2 isoform X1 [Octopus sinensis]|uniref:NADH dehydrogenase [ubiquinone] 1 alpha subcomplex assembly factor 2 isoform X1 n=1 Tax=Octopus sinensis TaxID=2607531 RepID=A0A6P7SRY0_9MOLL|nr:NADH dehydrogenase [ubiquinone] 1 alpha subcomplex assembly factor 2 isoform X1 [Octopus sinensis]
MLRVRSKMSRRAKWLWGLFKNSLYSVRQQKRIIGNDYFGNVYYEKEANPSRNLKGARWVERADGDQMTPPDMPVEWEAWIRGKRQNPPTEEEIQRNYAKMMKTIHRAKELEQKYASASPKFEENVLPRTRREFPEYPEYEIIPGEKTETDDKKK